MERRQSAWGRSVVKSATSWHHLFSELRCQRRAHGEQRRSRGAEGRMRLQWVNILVYRNWSSVPHPQTVYTHPGVCPSGEKKYTRGTDPFFCLTHFSFAVYLINFAFYPSFWLGKFFFTTCVASPVATLQGILVAHGSHLSPLSSFSDPSSNIEHKAPLCFPHHFLDYREQPSFSLHDLPWVPWGRFKQLLIREGRACETREKQSRETVMQSWGKVLVSHQRIHTTIPLSCFADTETPPGGRS